MGTENQDVYRQVYNAREDDNILAWTEYVSCVFTRRGLLAAAFNASNDLLSMHYAGYGGERPAWELDFFEPLFAHEPLLMKHDLIRKVSFFTERTIVVPDELYERDAAENWLRQIHFIEPGDVIEHYSLAEQQINYIYAIPKNIRELVNINSNKATIIPVQAYQSVHGSALQTYLQCLVSAEQACVSLYRFNLLLWQKVFDYSTAEDIAYEAGVVCREHNIDAQKLTVAFNALTAAEYAIANDLSQYFTAVTTGGGHTIKSVWSPALSLIKQLSSCE